MCFAVLSSFASVGGLFSLSPQLLCLYSLIRSSTILVVSVDWDKRFIIDCHLHWFGESIYYWSYFILIELICYPRSRSHSSLCDSHIQGGLLIILAASAIWIGGSYIELALLVNLIFVGHDNDLYHGQPCLFGGLVVGGEFITLIHISFHSLEDC